MGRALIELRPSDIRYTQDSIKNTFTFQHEGTLIGETLDDLCNAVCDISDIPLINVSYNDGHYWSSDNRRLWVFRQFERLGGCEKITVKEINWNRINPDKFTTENDGIEVKVRGYRRDPGGTWHRRPDNFLRGRNQSSHRPPHGGKGHSFGSHVMPSVTIVPTPPPQTKTTTVTGRQLPAYGRPIHNAYLDPYDYGHRASPLPKPVRPTGAVPPPARERTPAFQPTPSYMHSTGSDYSPESSRSNRSRDAIIDIATPYPKKSKKKSCCVIC